MARSCGRGYEAPAHLSIRAVFRGISPAHIEDAGAKPAALVSESFLKETLSWFLKISEGISSRDMLFGAGYGSRMVQETPVTARIYERFGGFRKCDQTSFKSHRPDHFLVFSPGGSASG